MGETRLSQQDPLPRAPETPTFINARGRPSRSTELAQNNPERKPASYLPHGHLAVGHLSPGGSFLFPSSGEDVRTHVDQDLQVLFIRFTRVVP